MRITVEAISRPRKTRRGVWYCGLKSRESGEWINVTADCRRLQKGMLVDVFPEDSGGRLWAREFAIVKRAESGDRPSVGSSGKAAAGVFGSRGDLIAAYQEYLHGMGELEPAAAVVAANCLIMLEAQGAVKAGDDSQGAPTWAKGGAPEIEDGPPW